MSDSIKLPLARVAEAAKALAEELRLSLDGEWMVAGSVRRGMGMCGDIDLVCCLPAPACAGAGTRDRLCGEILKRFQWLPRPQDLFRPAMGEKLGWIIKGAESLFKCCELVLVPRRGEGGGGGGGWGWTGADELKVQIHRYVPGPMGNQGLIEVLRTGPAEFGPVLLSLWKKRRARGSAYIREVEAPASEHGFLLDAHGVSIPTPTEESVFDLCGIPFIEPSRRSVENLNFVACRSGGGGGVGGGSMSLSPPRARTA